MTIQLTPNCHICQSDTRHGDDSIVHCQWRTAVVHFGCCTHNCSIDKRGPANCPHAKGIYQAHHLSIHPHSSKHRKD